MPDSKGPNWKLLLALAAAVFGVGAAAVFYVKRIKAKGEGVDRIVEDAVAFCKSKAAELDLLVQEASRTA